MAKGKAVRLSTGTSHRARKRFGQNFLRDQHIIDRIIDSFSATEKDHLLEIGPGQGALTKQLAATGAKLDCIELDRDLADHLSKQFADAENVSIYQQDILKFQLTELVKNSERLRIIGNLPYNISTPVMFHLLKSQTHIEDMTFMLQLEVVERLAAGVGDKNYGRLGLMVQYFCQVEHLFNVPATAFSPQPKVNSAIVRLTPHQQTLNDPQLKAKDVACLQMVVRTAFNQRRKTLKNSLKTLIPEETLNKLPIDCSLRPENISLKEYILISDVLADMTEGSN